MRCLGRWQFPLRLCQEEIHSFALAGVVVSVTADVEDTTDLMARHGNWVAAADAVNVLSSLEQFLSDSKNALDISSEVRSGLITKLRNVVTFARVTASEQGKFNLSLVY